MLVDRGPLADDSAPCKFAEKVWNAQKAGAQAVLVVNYEDKHTTMEAPDDQDEVGGREGGVGGWVGPPPARAVTLPPSHPSLFHQISYRYLRNITIPAAFITKSDGAALKDLVKAGDAYVTLDWGDVLPKASTVEWEFWSNSNDQCGAVCDVQKEFIKEFVPAARALEGAWTRFTPHYIVWVCPSAYRGSSECKSQCTHGGRYCTPDPDGDLRAGYSGADIVAENLRQLCVFKLANATTKPWLWWDYVTRFGESCTMASKKYGPDCAEKVFSDVGGTDWSSLDALRACVGNVGRDEPNAMLDAEMARQRGGGDAGEVFILPTIRINQRQYRGKLAYDDVLRAICAGFADGAQPAACAAAAGDACRSGSAGAAACAANTDGKTACRNTATGYECACGSGFISHVGPGGSETCLNINECVSASPADLDPKCTCDRCACKDTYGGYECIADIKDECARDHGGCWRKTYTIRGKRTEVSACRDRLPEFRDAAAHGRLTPDFPLHECACPPCFTEFKQNGRTECVPKCDLDACDAATGVCSSAPVWGGAGAPVWVSALVALASLAAVLGGAYAAYRVRLRAAMASEIRAIMAQYMPLDSADAGGGGGGGGVPGGV